MALRQGERLVIGDQAGPQHQVVRGLGHLRAAEGAGMHDIARKSRQHRPQPFHWVRLAADEAEERPLVRRTPAAAHGGIHNREAARRLRRGHFLHGLRVDRAEDGDEGARRGRPGELGHERAQLFVIAHADQHRFAGARECGEVPGPARAALLDRRPLRRIDVMDQSAKAFARQMADDRQAHATGTYYAHGADRFAHRFCVIVSMSAGSPAFTLAIALFSAAATWPGWSIGPSAYQPIERAMLAKSGAGSSMSMPM